MPRFNKNGGLVAGVMSLVTAATVAASSVGFGAPAPEKNPPSIREGSVQDPSSGTSRTRYFMGGGLHRGK